MLDRQKYACLLSELKAFRIKKKFSQADLAKNLHKPQSYISKVESGERNLDVIEFVNYCQAMNVSPTQLLKKLVVSFKF